MIKFNELYVLESKVLRSRGRNLYENYTPPEREQMLHTKSHNRTYYVDVLLIDVLPVHNEITQFYIHLQYVY